MLLALLLQLASATPPETVAPEALSLWAAEHDLGEHFPPLASAYTPLSVAYARIATLASAHPTRATVEVIGYTVLREPIFAVHIAPTATPTRSLLVFAGIHALEWISTETALQFLEDLFLAPPRHTRVTVLLALNVDGRLRAEGDLWLGHNTYRRGNAARPPVDLNRDFAVHRDAQSLWRHLLPAYHAASPRPLSQPETRALDALAARERYDIAVSLHAFGGYHYLPWAGRWRRPDDYREMFTLGRSMEAAEGPFAYRTRQLSRWGFFFRAQGAEIDHLYARYHTRAFLIELTRSGIDPTHPLSSARTYLRWYNPVRPHPHMERACAALRALLPGEGSFAEGALSQRGAR